MRAPPTDIIAKVNGRTAAFLADWEESFRAGERVDNTPRLDALLAAEKASEELPYGPMCRNPEACAGKGYCPLDPTCGD